MNNSYLERALEVVNERNILCNLAAKRASEISRGSKPLVEVAIGTVALDIALLEIAEGKVTYELPK